MSVSTFQPRTHWQVTWSVWQALFVREFLTRVAADRLAWFWMLFEPIAMIAIMVAIRAVVFGRDQHIDGAPFIPWLLLGLLGFYLFRENMMRSIGAIEASQNLFTYRQVQPVDPVLVRCFLEGTLKSFIFLLFVFAAGLLGIDMFPDRFMSALVAWTSLWLLGIGVALVLSSTSRMVPEIGKIVKITTFPLLLISSVIVPLNFMPYDLVQYLMWNPVVHGLELLRMGFVESYRPVDGTSMVYLWLWIMPMLLLGLLLHLRYRIQLKAR